MAVKELYDDADMLVGHAAAIKTGTQVSAASWVYVCHGPAGRCFSESPEFSENSPLYGVGTGTMCGPCHGGLVFSPPPP
jgi:hypothetical protein